MDEYVGNDWGKYSAPMPRHGHQWIKILQKERGQIPFVDLAYVPTMCNHCADAPCVKAATNGEITQRQDGIVLIDPEKSKGRKDLVDSCPMAISGGTTNSTSPGLAVRGPSDRSGLDQDAGFAGLPDHRDAGRVRGRRRHGPEGQGGRARSPQPRTRHKTTRLVQKPLALAAQPSSAAAYRLRGQRRG